MHFRENLYVFILKIYRASFKSFYENIKFWPRNCIYLLGNLYAHSLSFNMGRIFFSYAIMLENIEMKFNTQLIMIMNTHIISRRGHETETEGIECCLLNSIDQP